MSVEYSLILDKRYVPPVLNPGEIRNLKLPYSVMLDDSLINQETTLWVRNSGFGCDPLARVVVKDVHRYSVKNGKIHTKIKIKVNGNGLGRKI